MGIGFAIPINNVRELIPQLRTGKITRGVIGVEVGAVPVEALGEFGLKERRGALVNTVTKGQPAQKAGIEPGDVILEFNGKSVRNRDELVSTVIATKPGTTVPIKILRNRQEKTLNVTVGELNLDEENETETEVDTEDEGVGFGMTLTNLTAERARRVGAPAGTTGALVADVDPSGNAARGGVQPGDVIVRINGKDVSTPAEARRLLQDVAEGRTAFLHVLRQGRERFITVRKD
jgi:serine protease Do